MRGLDDRQDIIREDGGTWTTFVAMRRIHEWFEFLQFSPSYELARRHRAGQQLENLPADFDAVLAVYDDLGDVSGNYADWWLAGANRQFGHSGARPCVVSLGLTSSERPQFDRIAEAVGRYAQADWIMQGERTTLVAAIPAGLSKGAIIKQIAAMLDELPEHDRVLSPQAPKYQPTGKKLDWGSVGKYRRCLCEKRDNPTATLWQIGAAVRLSTMYDGRLDPTAKPAGEVDAKDRTALKILTSRALRRGHMIAENAARGIFPTYAACQNAVPLDWERIRRQRENRAVDEIGNVEFDAGPEFDPIWKQDSDGKWFDASAQGQKDRDRRQ
ncbi:MAG: hypothetical protein BGP16_11765 [Sphingobium sp. 66-54]|nr:MAG: hypothetical protein BGP16_11765 [Sphingobium sp. 66-54]